MTKPHLFHNAVSLDPNLPLSSSLQLMMSFSSSNSRWASRSSSSENSCSWVMEGRSKISGKKRNFGSI